jgi:uncharacterized protein YbjT (DUF2867 family)
MSCKVSFIGLGVMGYPMAGHLAKAGHAVTVFNRTPARAQRWKDEFGGVGATTPAAAAAGAEFVFCCVGNDDDLRRDPGDYGAFAQWAGAVRRPHHDLSPSPAISEGDVAASLSTLRFPAGKPAPQKGS